MACVWVPNWPIQRLRHERPNCRRRPVLLYAAEGQRGCVIAACSENARQQGVRVGLPLAEAVALCQARPTSTANPTLAQAADGTKALNEDDAADDDSIEPTEPLVERHDPDADRASFVRLAHRMDAFTPLFGIEDAPAPEALWLDLTGCTHLLGGDAFCAGRIEQSLRADGFIVRVKLARTWGAAWALAHYSKATVTDDATLEKRLSVLPIAALRVAPQVVTQLQELGIKSIGQLQALPRSSLPSRFGKQLLLRLDQAFGLATETLVREHLVEPVRSHWSSDYPLKNREQLRAVHEQLLDALLLQLQARREGLKRLSCSVVGRRTSSAEVASNDASSRTAADESSRGSNDWESVQQSIEFLVPCDQRQHILELIELRWDRIALPPGIQRVTLEAESFGLAAARQRTLFGEELAHEATEISQLINRLSGRLGPMAVVKPMLVADHEPERGMEWVPWVRCLECKRADRTESTEPVKFIEPRPLRLFARPQSIEMLQTTSDGAPHRFRWQRAAYIVRLCWGPERIESGWWRDDPLRRDYFRVELSTGQQWWLYRRLDELDWYWHGIFE